MRKSNYDKFPSTRTDGMAVIGWEKIVSTLNEQWADEPIWAIDLYTGTYEEDFLSAFAKNNDKLYAMTECGYKNIPDSTWFTRVLKPVMDRYKLSYFLLWRNYKEEYFGPSPELPCAADFKKLYEAENTLFLKDIISK